MVNYSEILAVEIKKYFGDGILVNELTELSDTLSPVQFQLSYSTAAEQFLNLSRSALAEIDKLFIMNFPLISRLHIRDNLHHHHFLPGCWIHQGPEQG